MRHDIALKWADALESGQYRQGRRALNRGGRLCCLGVLCEVLGLPGTADDEADPGCLYYSENAMDLPVEARSLSGVKTPDGRLPGSLAPLAVLNDAGHTFPQIAAIIRANWEEL
jgi:hypothetical protein